jgi:tryptophanyl-tRNA synthetase
MSRIELTDDPKSIEKKLRKAVTDSESVVSYEPERRPGVSTLVDIEAACSGLDPEECVENALMRAEDTGEYKKHVARLLNAHLLPVRTRYERLIRDRAYLRRVLDEGSAKAAQIAEANYLDIRRIIGMS